MVDFRHGYVVKDLPIIYQNNTFKDFKCNKMMASSYDKNSSIEYNA